MFVPLCDGLCFLRVWHVTTDVHQMGFTPEHSQKLGVTGSQPSYELQLGVVSLVVYKHSIFTTAIPEISWQTNHIQISITSRPVPHHKLTRFSKCEFPDNHFLRSVATEAYATFTLPKHSREL